MKVIKNSETALLVEAVLERVLTNITDRGVSVLTLGDEVSVNIEGEHHNFVLLSAPAGQPPKVVSVPTPQLPVPDELPDGPRVPERFDSDGNLIPSWVK